MYEDQDTNLWNKELIDKGEYYLKKHLKVISYQNIIWKQPSHGGTPTKKIQKKNGITSCSYTINIAIKIFAHGCIEPYLCTSAKAESNEKAIIEAEKLNLTGNHLYYSLLGKLYSTIDKEKALQHFQTALAMAKSKADKATLTQSINRL